MPAAMTPLTAAYPCPKVQSSRHKTHCSHPNLTSHSVTNSPPQVQHPQTGIHSTLVSQTSHSRSKGNLVAKKRPIGISRNNTSLILQKATTSSHSRKPPTSGQRRAPKRGAFKGALDPDLNEEHDDQQHPFESCPLDAAPKKSQKEEEAWISEPSTRSATPTTQQPPLELQSCLTFIQPVSSNPRLALQLPNPLPSNPSLPRLASPIPPTPSIPQPIDQPAYPSPPVEPSNLTPYQIQPHGHPSPQNTSTNLSSQWRGRSTKCHRNSIESSGPPERPTAIHADELPQSHDEHTAVPSTQAGPSTPPRNFEGQQPPLSTSPDRPGSLKGKGKTPPTSTSKTQRSSINSVRSLSSLSIFHNDLLISHTHSRQGLRRVDSTASVVLPPKVDTTEAVIALNSKGTFHPTLNAISDFLPESSEPHSNPLSYSTEPTSSHTCPQGPSDSAPSKVHAKQIQPLTSGPKTQSTSDQSECARRLQRFSNPSGQPHYINLKAANDSSSGLISSLLSPQITFKSRRAQTPGLQSHVGNGSGYFDSFKSLVGMSGLAGEPLRGNGPVNAPDIGNQPSEGTPPPASSSPLTCTPSSKSVTSTGAMSGSLPQDNKMGSNQNTLQRHPLVHHLQQLHGGPAKLSQPKPVVPGLITTCGPTPVVSKFLGPRPVQPLNQTDTFQSSITGVAPSHGWNNEIPGKVEKEVNQSTTSSLHAPPTLGNQSGPPKPPRKSGSDLTGSLSRIQKKLLMERDRPISPTLFEQLNHQTTGNDFVNTRNQVPGPGLNASGSSLSLGGGGQIGSGGSSGGTLPPPSYLIRSLGGQTGPLPFIPLNLLPSTQTTATPLNPNNHQGHNLFGPTKVTTTPCNEKKNAASGTPHHLKDAHLNTKQSPPTGMAQPQSPEVTWLSSSSDVGNGGGSRLNEPALKAKQALSIKLWRNSLIDEVEQILTDHESNTRFRNPLIESFQRISEFNQSFSNL